MLDTTPLYQNCHEQFTKTKKKPSKKIQSNQIKELEKDKRVSRNAYRLLRSVQRTIPIFKIKVVVFRLLHR